MPGRSADPTAGQILLRLARHPWAGVLRRWNWKSALLSAVTRGLLFFAANISAGWRAASTNAYHSTSGGIKTFYHALLAAAPRHARRVNLVVPGACDGVERVNPFATIHTIRARRAPIVDRRYRLILPHRFIRPGAGALWSILDREQPDLIEVCDKYSLCYLAGLIRKLRPTRPALVGLTCERMDDNVRAVLGNAPWTARFAKRYIRDVYQPQFDAHIANSAYTAAEMSRNPRHPRPVYVRHMGVDTTTFTPDRGNRWRRDRRRAALAFAVVNALVDETERQRRRQRALATAAAHSWPAAAAAYFELYDDIVVRRLRATEPTMPVRSPDAADTNRIGSLSR